MFGFFLAGLAVVASAYGGCVEDISSSEGYMNCAMGYVRYLSAMDDSLSVMEKAMYMCR